ncbi:MAG: 7-cyano-7-deazaguanine synthase [Nanoarchaeota archaeon]|nr:7-cyano-7-deazaguanine synthase [Nanoarchaeota archaeon]
MKQKCIVLFSGGLDSRLAVKIMQERGFEVLALHFNLPFGCGCCDFGCNFNFTQTSGTKFKIFDCEKGKLLREYLKILKKGKHGRGAGYNPCRDCKIFMFKKAKKYADEKGIKVIATGEVLGQRPMSQTRKAMKIIDEKIRFKLVRPLIELGISGRRRNKQIELAKKFKISYPSPAGGCLLCEKAQKNKFKVLLKNNLINEKALPLVSIGRHFYINNCWLVIGRNFEENKVIEKFKSFIKSEKGKPAVYYSKKNCRRFAEDLQEDYKKGGIKKYSREKL